MRHSLEIKLELYKRGDYDALGLFDKQLSALKSLNDDIANEVLYGGGARGGKSFILSVWKILARLSMSGSHGLIAREERVRLIDTTQKTYFKTMDILGCEEGVDYEFSIGHQRVTFSNGSTEVFRDMKYQVRNDPEFDRIGSYDLTDAAIDEAQQIHWKGIDVLKGRFSELRGKNKVMKNGVITYEDWHTVPKALYTCNPAKNWIHSDFYKPHVQKQLDPSRVFIPSLPSDNPHVEESYIENLRRAEKTTRERLLYGNFDYDDDPDALCEWDAICDIFNNDHVLPDVRNKRLVTDLAMLGRDRFIVTYWEGMVCYVSLVKTKSTGKEIEEDLRGLKKSKGVPNRRIIADSDGLGSYLSSYIENIQEFRGGSSPTDPKYGNFKDQCGFKLAEMINDSSIRIVCSKEDEEVIKQEISLCLKRSTNVDDEKKRLIKKSVMKEKYGGSPDFLDVLMMGMWPEIEEDFDPIA